MEMQTRFKSKEQDAEIKLQQAESAKQKNFNRFLIAGGVLMLGIAVLAIIAFRNKRKAHLLSESQKQEIEKQKSLVDEAYEKLNDKNKEILDSIHYAKRIQTALMPPEKYIEKSIRKNTKKYGKKYELENTFKKTTKKIQNGKYKKNPNKLKKNKFSYSCLWPI